LRTGKKAVGVLNLSRSAGNAPFTPSDLNLLSIVSAQIATALENARLFEETERLKAFNESIVQGVAEAILIEDAQGVITFVNPALEALLEYSRQELVGQHWSIMVPEDQIERVREQTAERPLGIDGRYETALRAKSGQVVPVIVSARPLFEGGEFAGVLAAFTDITERVRAEEALELRMEQLTA
jgi:PAS domain S-box-containing protein